MRTPAPTESQNLDIYPRNEVDFLHHLDTIYELK
jgi:hypothetical protein